MSHRINPEKFIQPVMALTQQSTQEEEERKKEKKDRFIHYPQPIKVGTNKIHTSLSRCHMTINNYLQ